MQGVTLNFDANQVEPNKALDPIPAGWYHAKIIESEMKPTKDGKGAYLALTLEVLDGEHAKRKLFDRLNLQNSNETAVRIAWGTLSAICRAVGVIQCANSQQLHGLPLRVKVSLKPSDGQYDASNDVKGYESINAPAHVPGPTGTAPAPAFAPPPAAPAAPAFASPPVAPTPAAPAAWSPPPPPPTATAPTAPVQPPWMQGQPPAGAPPPAVPTPPWGQPPTR